MALIPCKNCGSLVSDRAPRCVKCGCLLGYNNVDYTVNQSVYNPIIPEEQPHGNRKHTFLRGMAIVAVVIIVSYGMLLAAWYKNDVERNQSKMVISKSRMERYADEHEDLCERIDGILDVRNEVKKSIDNGTYKKEREGFYDDYIEYGEELSIAAFAYYDGDNLLEGLDEEIDNLSKREKSAFDNYTEQFEKYLKYEEMYDNRSFVKFSYREDVAPYSILVFCLFFLGSGIAWMIYSRKSKNSNG